jgi:hypothetical protein
MPSGVTANLLDVGVVKTLGLVGPTSGHADADERLVNDAADFLHYRAIIFAPVGVAIE